MVKLWSFMQARIRGSMAARALYGQSRNPQATDPPIIDPSVAEFSLVRICRSRRTTSTTGLLF